MIPLAIPAAATPVPTPAPIHVVFTTTPSPTPKPTATPWSGWVRTPYTPYGTPITPLKCTQGWGVSRHGIQSILKEWGYQFKSSGSGVVATRGSTDVVLFDPDQGEYVDFDI